MNYKIWDKIEPINGGDASYIIKVMNIKETDDVFLLTHGDKVTHIEVAETVKDILKLPKHWDVETVAKEYLKIVKLRYKACRCNMGCAYDNEY